MISHRIPEARPRPGRPCHDVAIHRELCLACARLYYHPSRPPLRVIAEVFGCSVETVRARVRSAILILDRDGDEVRRMSRLVKRLIRPG